MTVAIMAGPGGPLPPTSIDSAVNRRRSLALRQRATIARPSASPFREPSATVREADRAAGIGDAAAGHVERRGTSPASSGSRFGWSASPGLTSLILAPLATVSASRASRPIASPASVHGTARRGPRDRATSLDAAALATAPASTASRASLAAGTAGAAPAALEQHGRSRRAHGPDWADAEGNLGAWNKKLDRASLRPGTRAGWCG